MLLIYLQKRFKRSEIHYLLLATEYLQLQPEREEKKRERIKSPSGKKDRAGDLSHVITKQNMSDSYKMLPTVSDRIIFPLKSRNHSERDDKSLIILFNILWLDILFLGTDVKLIKMTQSSERANIKDRLNM